MIGFPLLLCYFCLKRKKSGTTPDCQGKDCVVLCLLVLTTIFRCQTLTSVLRFVR